MPEYRLASNTVLIMGNGRSGSNRLLDILDLSKHTVCRNEANEIHDSQFSKISGPLFRADFVESDYTELVSALQCASSRRSARDRFDRFDKDFFNLAGSHLKFIMGKQKVRRYLHKLRVLDGEHEFDIDLLLRKPKKNQGMHLILKLNACPMWAVISEDLELDIKVIHNIRHPIDYLNSWYNRFILSGIGFSSFNENFSDVPIIFRHYGLSDVERLKDETLDNLIEVQLWRWRYVNEVLLRFGQDNNRAMLVKYDEIEANPSLVGKKVYEFAGLTYDSATASNVARLENKLFARSHSKKLDPKLCETLIQSVLRDSPLLNLW